MLKRDNGTKDRYFKTYGDFAAVPNFHHRFLPSTFLMTDVDCYEYEKVGNKLVVHAIFEQKLILKNKFDRPYFKDLYKRTFYFGSSGHLAVEQAKLNECALYLVAYDVGPWKKIYQNKGMTIGNISQLYDITNPKYLLKRVYVYKIDTAWTNWTLENYDYENWTEYSEREFVQFLYKIRGKQLH